MRSCFRASFRQVYTATVFDEEAKTNKTLEEVRSTLKTPQFSHKMKDRIIIAKQNVCSPFPFRINKLCFAHYHTCKFPTGLPPFNLMFSLKYFFLIFECSVPLASYYNRLARVNKALNANYAMNHSEYEEKAGSRCQAQKTNNWCQALENMQLFQNAEKRA